VDVGNAPQPYRAMMMMMMKWLLLHVLLVLLQLVPPVLDLPMIDEYSAFALVGPWFDD
jgi:hypothetical protein